MTAQPSAGRPPHLSESGAPAEPVVSSDESGNTHGNLLDPEQPVAVLASCALGDGLAAECLAELRGQTRTRDGDELHFRGLKSPRARKAVLDFLQHPALTPQTVKVAFAHKPFSLVAKMVDITVETMTNANDYDLYADGQALALSNLLYLCAPLGPGAPAWEHLVRTFQKLCGDPTDAGRLTALQDAVSVWAGDAEDLGSIRTFVADAAGWAREGLTQKSGPLDDPLDPALPLFACLAWEWADQLGPYRVRHDHSTVIDRWTDVLMHLERLPDPSDSSRTLRPLKIVHDGLDATADSVYHPGVQVADLVVGAVRAWTKELAKGQRTDPGELFEDATRVWTARAVWPDPSALGGTPVNPTD